MTTRSLTNLHPLLAYAFGKAEMRWLLTSPKLPVPFITATFRDGAEQDALYRQPFDKKDNDGDGKIDEPDEFVTNAKAGQSPHNFPQSFAFDIAFKNKEGKTVWDAVLFEEFAHILLETPGITWGGNFKSFKDRPHFELTGWQLLAKK